MSGMKIFHAGDTALLLQFGEGISARVNERVHRFFFCLRDRELPGIIEAVPGYRSLLVYYDPLAVEVMPLKKELRAIAEAIKTTDWTTSAEIKRVRIPVALGGEFGPDLEALARLHGLEVEEAIDLFIRQEYSVYMMAFVAGAPLLGRVVRKLATPRHSTPRLRVPSGSIGIGNVQIAIYPHDLPGGMQIIARTPIEIYDPKRELLPSLLNTGDRVIFERIDEAQYRDIEKRVTSGAEDMTKYLL